METNETPTLAPTNGKEKTLVNRVPKFCMARNITPTIFKGHVIASGLSFDTADRLINGEVNFTIKTIATIADYFKCEISELIGLE